MKLTKQQKVLAAVLGAGLLVVVGDRVFLADSATGPTDASGAAFAPAATTDASPRAVARPAADPTATLALLDVSMAGRLRDHAEQRGLTPGQTRDAFRPPATWGGGTSPGAVTTPAAERIDAFVREHRLMAVMGAGSGALAIVNGQAYRVGQSLGDFRLVEVRGRTAVFESPFGAAELSLSEGG
jgi:hypothetical protein